MSRNPGVRTGLRFIVVAVCILCSLSTSFAQQRLRISGAGITGGPCNPQASLTGCWSTAMIGTSWVEAIHAALVPTGDQTNPVGKVLIFDFGTYNTTNPPCVTQIPCTRVNAKLWDPQCKALDPSDPTCFQDVPLTIYDRLLGSTAPYPTATIFCAGHSVLQDGKLVVTGGDHLVEGAGVNPDYK